MSTFDPYHKWLGIPKAEQPPHHYRLLGIAAFETDPDVIEAAADRQMAYVRQCATGPYTSQSQQILNELSAARVCLLNAAKKEAYDRELRARLAPPVAKAPAARPSTVAAGEGAENALLLLQQSVAEGDVTTARRTASTKRKTVPPNAYWLWGGIGSVALLLVGGILYAISQPGPEPVRQGDQTTNAATARKAARKPKTDQSPAQRESISKNAAPKKSGAPAVAETITNSIGMKIVLVPAGEFQMGADESAAATLKAFPYTATAWVEGERPRHRVRITRPFYMGTCEVTVEQFMKFYDAAGKTMGEVKDIPTGWGYDPNQPDLARRQVLPWAPGWERIDDHPVVLVSWNDADAFCQWLSRQEGKTYRLPTEAEWEYACRAGSATRFWCGNDPDELSRIANVPDREMKNLWPGSWTLEIRDGKQTQNQIPFPFVFGTDGYAFSAPVGNYPPNAFGLYDMHGNVGEWCRDWYDANYYSQSPVDDPPGPTTGSQRVLRGGGWRSYPLHARSAYRSGIAPTYRDNQLGFRVVCEMKTGPRSSTEPPAQPAGGATVESPTPGTIVAPLTILAADYGSGARKIDLTQRMQKGAQSGLLVAFVEPALSGGKSSGDLVLRYRVGDLDFEKKFLHGEFVFLDVRVPPRIPGQGLVILEALYGAGIWGEGRMVDVKQRLSDRIRNGRVSVPVKELVAGIPDPAPGASKVLIVRYNLDGQDTFIKFEDHQTVELGRQ